MSELANKTCIPCQGGVPPLPVEERKTLLADLHTDWQLTHDDSRLLRSFKFKDFKKPYDLVKQISELAEEQWHHPDIRFGWGYLEVEIFTHKIQSLVESDFIFAAKVDKMAQSILE